MIEEYYNRNMEGSYKGCFWCFVGIVVFTILAILTGCKSVQYVPVETTKTELIHHHDTIRIQDSIRTENTTVIREADSAEIERLTKEYGIKIDKAQKTILVLRKELERQSHQQSEIKNDTIEKEKVVQVPVPVEKKLTKWQQACISYGKLMISLIVLAIIIIFVLISLLIRRKLLGKV